LVFLDERRRQIAGRIYADAYTHGGSPELSSPLAGNIATFRERRQEIEGESRLVGVAHPIYLVRSRLPDRRDLDQPERSALRASFHCSSRRCADTGSAVFSSCANSETRNSSIIQRHWASSGTAFNSASKSSRLASSCRLSSDGCSCAMALRSLPGLFGARSMRSSTACR